jgi:hypothetical protein
MANPVGSGAARGLNFIVEVDATSDLAVDDDHVTALITVRAAGTGALATRHAEVLIMDRSRSMLYQAKMREAQHAACAAIDALPDTVLLGVIAGSNSAERIFPPHAGLAAADDATKAAAKRAVMNLRAGGGTAIGQWLSAAGELFTTGPAAGVVRHAVLYSDGKNEHETRPELDAALNACTDRFVCDVRGLGDDWDYRELQHIADAMHGEAASVTNVTDFTADFTGLMRRMQRLAVPRTYLRLRPDRRFKITSVKQARPVDVDLTAQQQPSGGTGIDVPLGAWAEGIRIYRVVLHFEPGALPLEQEVRATPVELLAETPSGALEQRADAALAVCRRRIPRDGTKPSPPTHWEKLEKLTITIRSCVDAWEDGQTAEADDELDSAIRLAREISDIRLRLLEEVAITRDGRARLRPDVTRGEMHRLGLGSRMTGEWTEGEGIQPPARAWKCGKCGETTYADHPMGCEACGARFGEQDPS